jgi:hypothetical protein
MHFRRQSVLREQQQTEELQQRLDELNRRARSWPFIQVPSGTREELLNFVRTVESRWGLPFPLTEETRKWLDPDL